MDFYSSKEKYKIAVFASGAGTNAEKIINYSSKNYKVGLIVCNKPGAGVLSIASRHKIPALIIDKGGFENGTLLDELKKHQIDFIVLAGFLWKIPFYLIRAYPKKIINIHPALLPKYGGKGMYGERVHEAVIANKEVESGISIHYVDEIYDNGEIIFQATCPISNFETPETLAQKVHLLEHKHYPEVISTILKKQNEG